MSGEALIRILGGGGHGRVAADAWRSAGGKVLALHDDAEELGLDDIGRAVLSRDALHIAIGNNDVRQRISASLADERFPPVMHSCSTISPSAALGAGSLVCAMAVIQANAKIGRHTIINTAAVIEHDCLIGDFVHIAPGVRLAGNVTIANSVLVGIGAIVIPGIQIGASAIIGAGSVVIRDVPDGARVAGNPARLLR